MRYRVTVEFDVETDYQGDKLADQLVEFLGHNRPELTCSEEVGRNVTVQLPEGIKGIRYEDEPMIGDYLLIDFENGLTLGVNALHLGDQECNVALYSKRVPEEGRYDILASLEFGTEQRPDAVVYHGEWAAFKREQA